MFTLSFVVLVAIAGEPAPAWHNSFADGRQAALKANKDLFIYFRPDDRLDEALRDDSIKALLRNYVCVKVPPDHKYQGKLYALPIAVQEYKLLYNRDLFSAAGISAPPATMDEFATDISKLTKQDSSGTITL